MVFTGIIDFFDCLDFPYLFYFLYFLKQIVSIFR